MKSAALRMLPTIALVALAIFFWIFSSPQDWMTPAGEPYAAASRDAWFGTNRIGQDLFARNMAAAAQAFEVAIPVALLAVAMGFGIGASAALSRRWQPVANVLINALDAIPYYLIVVSLATWSGGSSAGFILAISAGLWTTTARIVREECSRIADCDYFRIAKSLGASRRYLLTEHLLPALRPVLTTQFIILFAVAIKVEVVLTFLGLGYSGKPSWGLMLASAGDELVAGHYGNLVIAGVSVTMLLWSLNATADAMANRGGGSAH